jgi:DNA methylase N-4/N-6 domain protein|nr:MAG TPA: ParB protein [Caudoviricetes sp.]
MNIIKMKVEDLIPYVNNPRNNENAVDKVASSIAEFGFKNPIVIDKNNIVINGHTRLLASKKLGLKEVPVIKADDLTEAQVKAFRIADNKTSEYAEWNEDLLKLELKQLEELNFDLECTGFDVEEIEQMLNLGFDYSEDEFGEDFELPSGDKSPIQQRTFTLHDNQASLIDFAMSEIKEKYNNDNLETFGNTNINGNLLYMVVKEWVERKK